MRVLDSTAPRAFSATELEAATTALSVLLAKGVGTVLDLAAGDFTSDGKIFTTEQAPYDGVIVLGLPGEQLEAATQKLIRLLNPAGGQWVAALTSPVPLQVAARCEQLIEKTLGVMARTALQASRHDEQHEALPNTVVGFSWSPAKVASAEMTRSSETGA